MNPLSRRDVLKFTGASIAGLGLTRLMKYSSRISGPAGRLPNIIIIVLDAMSARNLSVYDYPRPTTPNLEKFSQRATVYHSHTSGGSFTSSGTASMLTGLYPWHHRALSRRALVRRDLESSSIFHAVPKEYSRVGYSQNLWADLFLRQFRSGIDIHIPPSKFSYLPETMLASHNVTKDSAVAYYALDEFLLSTHQVLNPYPGSVGLGYLDFLYGKQQKRGSEGTEEYPYGVPSNSYYLYRHTDVFSGWADYARALSAKSNPWLGYFHLYSPHAPYRPRAEFVGTMPDYPFLVKRRHFLADGTLSTRQLLKLRMKYDEFIADVDAELGNYLWTLDSAGILDNSYVFITSDHGEVFERGEAGHGSPLLYDPVIHIPLMVLSPGQRERIDIHTPTSNVDLLPTIAHLSGGTSPAQCDGRILPGLGGQADPDRAIFSVVAKENSSFRPITTGTVALTRGSQKLIYYKGYRNFPDQFELFDLEADIEEKRNILESAPSAADKIKKELLSALKEADAPYEHNS